MPHLNVITASNNGSFRYASSSLISSLGLHAVRYEKRLIHARYFGILTEEEKGENSLIDFWCQRRPTLVQELRAMLWSVILLLSTLVVML